MYFLVSTAHEAADELDDADAAFEVTDAGVEAVADAVADAAAGAAANLLLTATAAAALELEEELERELAFEETLALVIVLKVEAAGVEVVFGVLKTLAEAEAEAAGLELAC